MKFWNNLPSPLRSYLVSFTLTAQSVLATMVTVGYGLGLCGSPEATIHYIISNAWAGLMAAFLGIGPYYHASKAQGVVNSNNAVASALAARPPVVYTSGATYAPPSLPPATPVTPNVTLSIPIGDNQAPVNTTLNELMVILNLFFPNNATVKVVEAVLTGIETGQSFSVPLAIGGKSGNIVWTPTP